MLYSVLVLVQLLDRWLLMLLHPQIDRIFQVALEATLHGGMEISAALKFTVFAGRPSASSLRCIDIVLESLRLLRHASFQIFYCLLQSLLNNSRINEIFDVVAVALVLSRSRDCELGVGSVHW
jgi:hypothetical protein